MNLDWQGGAIVLHGDPAFFFVDVHLPCSESTQRKKGSQTFGLDVGHVIWITLKVVTGIHQDLIKDFVEARNEVDLRIPNKSNVTDAGRENGGPGFSLNNLLLGVVPNPKPQRKMLQYAPIQRFQFRKTVQKISKDS